MTFSRMISMAAATASLLSTPVFAQDAQFQLPQQCAAEPGMGKMPIAGMHGAPMGNGNQAGGMGSDMMGMMGMDDMDLDAMPAHVQENMRKMMATMPAMHQGMMHEDADVAFACGMIAHHQGAIDMAQALLKHGQDKTMRALAEEIIAAQVGEIQKMTTWLAENAK